jgi:hypothetical protein
MDCNQIMGDCKVSAPLWKTYFNLVHSHLNSDLNIIFHIIPSPFNLRPPKLQNNNTRNSPNNRHLQTIFNMVAMKTLLAVLPFFLSVATALPSDTTANEMLAPAPAVADENGNSNVDFAADAAAWNVSASSGKVDVEFYKDKNPDKNTRIDANTCNGQADIALMK